LSKGRRSLSKPLRAFETSFDRLRMNGRCFDKLSTNGLQWNDPQ